jgi:hypothetical protein
MFYAMTGAKFSGKDTVARAIINELALRGNTAEKVSFAGPLKEALCVMFGWTYEQIENHEFKETPEPITGKTPRKIMQLLGTEFGRETLHPELWLRIALSTMRKMECNGIVPIITDVRFENEAEFVRSHGGTLIHVDYIQAQALVVFHHVTELILAQHTMIYEDTGKVLTDSLVQENGSHTGVNTARKTEDNLIVAQLFLQLSNCCLNKRVSTPVLLTSADINHEVLQELCTLQRVEQEKVVHFYFLF